MPHVTINVPVVQPHPFIINIVEYTYITITITHKIIFPVNAITSIAAFPSNRLYGCIIPGHGRQTQSAMKCGIEIDIQSAMRLFNRMQ